jgi:hypothetical protein
MQRDKPTLTGMRLVALCLLASAVLPSVSRAQVPVFEVTPARKLDYVRRRGVGDYIGHFRLVGRHSNIYVS